MNVLREYRFVWPVFLSICILEDHGLISPLVFW